MSGADPAWTTPAPYLNVSAKGRQVQMHASFAGDNCTVALEPWASVKLGAATIMIALYVALLGRSTKPSTFMAAYRDAKRYESRPDERSIYTRWVKDEYVDQFDDAGELFNRVMTPKARRAWGVIAHLRLRTNGCQSTPLEPA